MKYLEYIKIETKTKTDVYNIVRIDNNDMILGQIKWIPGWRKYGFWPSPDTCFDSKCLTDIIDFITKLMNERK